MNPAEILEMARMEQVYWWHLGKRELIRSILSKFYPERKGAILDYGCGTGENIVTLSQFGTVHGADTSAVATEFCRGKGLANIHTIEAGEIPGSDYSLITAFDVIEHIRDDLGTLEHFHRALGEKGYLFISVPAYRFLWSEHDEALQHVRRYVASELHAKLSMTGFEVLKITYAVTFAFFPILAYRLLRGIFPKNYEEPKVSYIMLPGFLNAFFHGLLLLEAKMIRVVNLPFGCSILVLARKRGAGYGARGTGRCGSRPPEGHAEHAAGSDKGSP